MPARGAGALLAGALLFSPTVMSWRPVAVAPAAPARLEAAGAASAGGHDVSGHEDAEGLKLIPAKSESPVPGTACDPDAPVRHYEVAAIAVDMTLNRWGDHDPQGRMFALADAVGAVREEERHNAAARVSPVAGAVDPAVTLGLQGDAIQPLTLRTRPGECLRIRLRNSLAGEDVSLSVHGSALRVVGGGPAVVANRAATAKPGGTVFYEWAVPAAEPEATHYFHSHGPDERAQAGHGLFGAVIVEPPGSSWVDPRHPDRPATGWDAVVRDPAGPDFREFALYYHELGDETYQVRDRTGAFVPLVDPITHAYRPGTRALNYRSEPFLNRLRLGLEVTGRADESLEYSSYAFGDPATPVLRTYLGDPVKQRVLHAGPEAFHVHHVHGGTVRWRRQAGVEPSALDSGLDKHPPLTPVRSERTDSQTLGPSETFDVTDECGAGGCQASVGDFLYHCHVAHHYFAGMWGLWRVYNTLQDGTASTDALPPLPGLDERAGRVRAAVTSAGLSIPAGSDLSAVVESQLPPSGARAGDDASTLDWVREGDLYGNEPETTAVWANYRSPTPGVRPPLLFEPDSGRLAYPFLRPHLAVRPPFSPHHGPAPYLDPIRSGHDPPPPGASGPASVCPAGTTPVSMPVNAISLPITLNAAQNLVDRDGQLFVRREQAEAVRRDPDLQVPLVVRGRAGQDCVDVLLRSELADTPDVPYSKVGLHVHFVQFDVQGSDGLDAGFNFEQTVRPFRAEGATLAAPAPAGATRLRLAAGRSYRPGVTIGVGLDRDAEFETAVVAGVDGSDLVLTEPLRHPHQRGEVAGTEFVRYRWYPDAQFGTSYFHDHVNALSTWRHGLFGAFVAEPPDSTWTDPHTGDPLPSGAIADVHSHGPVGVDVSGSFRELVLLTQDDQPLTHVGRATGSSYNLRAEPLDGRKGAPSRLFSSAEHGDPATPRLEANLADPVVIRSLVGAANEIHTTHIDGHWFRVEPWSPTSPPVSTVRIGISERFDLVVPHAGGPQRLPGDYMYFNGRPSKLREGSWGLVRVYGPGEGGLRPLPGHESVPSPSPRLCPAGAPERRFEVAAVDAPLPMLAAEGGAPGKVYVLEKDLPAVEAGRRDPEPLVLHVSVGDCLVVKLRNATRAGPVSYTCDLLASDPSANGGPGAGREPDQSVPPGGTRTYRFYASPEVGETVAVSRDWGDPLTNTALGLYGAVVVGPEGARYRHPTTGADLAGEASWQVDVVPAAGSAWRDFTLVFQDGDDSIGTHRMPYTNHVRGVTGVNYRVAPDVPALEANAGDDVRIHLVAPSSEQAQVFSLEGHRWPAEPGLAGTPLRSSQAFAGAEAMTLRLDGGAGGPEGLAGTYRWEDHRLPYAEAGLWGELHVRPPGGRSIEPALLPLAESRSQASTGAALFGVGAAGAVAALALFTRRRHARKAPRRRARPQAT